MTTAFHFEQASVVRTVTAVKPATWLGHAWSFGSGWSASVDGGDACATCGHRPAKSISDIDSSWFAKVKP